MRINLSLWRCVTTGERVTDNVHRPEERKINKCTVSLPSWSVAPNAITDDQHTAAYLSTRLIDSFVFIDL